MSGENIKDFLISLGYASSQAGQRDFEDALTKATLKARLLADGLEELARKAMDSVAGVAQNFNQLYAQAQRTNTAAGFVSDFATVIARAGGSANEAASAVESMAAKLKAGVISIQDANRMGFGKNPLTGELELQRKYLEGVSGISDTLLIQGANIVGMSADVARLMKQQNVALLEGQDRLKAFRAALGFDPKKAQEDAHAFSQVWLDVQTEVGFIGGKISAGLTEAMIKPLQVLNQFLVDHAKEIGADIDIIMTSLLKMTDQWAIDLDKLTKDPTALDGFMHSIAVDIADMARDFRGFVADIEYLNSIGNKVADILNHLTGQKGHWSGWSDEMGGDPGAFGRPGVAPENETLMQRAMNWWGSHAPAWAGGGRGGGGGGGGEGVGRGGISSGPLPPGAQRSDAKNLTDLIAEAAASQGADGPQIARIMEGIRAGESRHNETYDVKDDAMESSWGPFQLNRRRGLGVLFEKDTGLDVTNPNTIPAQAYWVARYIKAHGGPNGQWMGYRGPMDADPRWGNSAYRPSSAETSTAPTGAPENRGDVSSEYGNLRLTPDAASGGPAAAGLIALAHHVQDTEDVERFHAFRDKFHVFENPNSAHNKGLAFDVSTKDQNYEASRQRTRAYLTGLGLVEGSMSGGSGDFAIEAGTTNHMHVQFNSAEAAQRYLELTAPKAAVTAAAVAKVSVRAPVAASAPPLWHGVGSWPHSGPGETMLGGVRPVLGGAEPAGATSIHAPMETKIMIDGSNDHYGHSPHMVGSHITQQPADLTRNLQGATN